MFVGAINPWRTQFPKRPLADILEATIRVTTDPEEVERLEEFLSWVRDYDGDTVPVALYPERPAEFLFGIDFTGAGNLT